MESNGFMNISKAAEYLKVTRQTIYNWIKAGKISPVIIMGLPYLPVTELNKIKEKADGNKAD